MSIRKLFLLASILLPNVLCFAQKETPKPKLIVGIVVDQMRYDFLYRYWNKYGNGGFKYLLKNGRSFENMHYNYTPTYTGPGHAAIYTGTTPAYNGIVANDWYDRKTGLATYVVADANVNTVGSSSIYGKMSPDHLLTTTITDELEIFTNQQSKVIGIALKDRGAILPAGNAADAAYWFDPSTGTWITSSFYMDQLPDYVNTFNNKKLAPYYLDQVWTTLLPIDQYTESTADSTRYELSYRGEAKPVFPHDIKSIRPLYDYALLSKTPFGNSFTTDFALEVLKREEMGKDAITDFLALSYSSTDYVGHQFGPNAIETEDTYLRLDLELKRLFEYLEKNVGKGNFLVFLTADHGVMNSAPYLDDLNIHTGAFERVHYQMDLRVHLNTVLGNENWLSYYDNQQVYLNRDLIRTKGISLNDVQDKVVEYTRNYPGVADAIPAYQIQTAVGNDMFRKIQLGYNYDRCGDVLIVLEPQWIDDENAMNGGTTHGSGYAYDTHVPFIIWGRGITAGSTNQEAYITDIAPTLANYLKIMEPSGTTGKVLDLK